MGNWDKCKPKHGCRFALSVGLDEGNNAIQTTPLLIDESGNARVTYIIRAKNYSNTPASNVWAFANLVVADDMRTVYEWQGYARTDEVIGKPDIGQILFPGRDRVFTSMPAIAKIIKRMRVVGCKRGWLDALGTVTSSGISIELNSYLCFAMLLVRSLFSTHLSSRLPSLGPSSRVAVLLMLAE
jgi:hypothetical protein